MMLWRVFRHELRYMTSQWRTSWRSTCHSTTTLILCRCVFSPLRIHSLFSRLNTPKVWPYMVMWREIWIYLITTNSTPCYPIEMGFSSEIIEFYAENYYQTFNTSFLNFLSDAEFGHSRWRHNSSHMGWNKHQ